MNASTSHTGTPRPEKGAEFFDKVRQSGLVRPDDRRWGAGVAVGVADRLGVDPLLIRGILVATSFFGGAALLAYGIAWALMPQPDGRIHAQRLLSGDVAAGSVGAGVVILLGLTGNFGPFDDGPGLFWGNPGGLVLAGLIGLGLWWLFAKRGRSQRGSTDEVSGSPTSHTSYEPAPVATGYSPSTGAEAPLYGSPSAAPVARPPAAPVSPPAPDLQAPSHLITRATLGIALLAAAVAVLLDNTVGLPGATWLLAGTVALGAVALGVLAAGVLGRRSGGLAPVGVLLALVVVLGSVLPGGARFGEDWRDNGTESWTPTSLIEMQDGFDQGAGSVIVDLTKFDGPTTGGPTRVDVNLGFGEMELRVPEDVTVHVDANVGAGTLLAPDGQDRGGFGASETFRLGNGEPQMIVDANVGFGELRVKTAEAAAVTP